MIINSKRKDLLVIIPARSGSKGIKNKNIACIDGKPLIMHTYDYARDELIDIDCLIRVSTDSEEYKKKFVDWGISPEEVLIRPCFLAEDLVTDLPVAIHATAEVEKETSIKFKYIMWLRPTSPFRRSGLLLDALRLIKDHPACSSVRSFRKPKEHPYRMWEIHPTERYAQQLIIGIEQPYSWPRQTLPNQYLFQTGDVEVCRRQTLQSGSMLGDSVLPLIIDESSIDIDSLSDLQG